MDANLTACPGTVYAQDQVESTLTVNSGIRVTKEVPLWITIKSGSIWFNIHGDAADGAKYDVGDSFPITIIPGANDLRFKGTADTDFFNVSIYS